MRKLDRLAADCPGTCKLIGQTDIDKTDSMPKSYIGYRKQRDTGKVMEHHFGR